MKYRGILILGIMTIALFCYIFFYEQKQPSTDERLEKQNRVFDLELQDISEIRYEGKELTYRLEKTNDTWFIREPLDYPAEESLVNNLLSSITDLEKYRTLNEADPGEFGVTEPTRTLSFKTGEIMHTIAFGVEIPATTTLAIRVDDSPEIYIIQKGLLGHCDRPVNDFRRKRVFDIESSDVQRMTLEKGGKPAEYVKRNSFWFIERPFRDRADRTRIEDILSGITGLLALEFVDNYDDSTLSDSGLTSAVIHVVLSDAENNPLAEFSIGRSGKDTGNRFSVLTGNRMLRCDSKLWSDMLVDSESLRDPKLIAFERWSLENLALTVGDFQHSLHKDPETFSWLYGTEEINPPSLADSIIETLARLKSNETCPELKTMKELGTIQIFWDGGDSLLKLYDCPDREKVLASVDDRAGFYCIPRDEWEGILTVIREIESGSRPEEQKTPEKQDAGD